MSEPGPETLLLAELSPKLAEHEAARYALRPGDTVDGLRVDGFLGAGASGEVYAVYDPALDTVCALKLLRRSESAVRDAFLREARLLAALRHPNVVRVMRAGVWRERPYFVMEKLAPLPPAPSPDEVRRWIVALCGALSELAPRGLSHCDIKPDNVLWDAAHRQPVLADFGIAVASGAHASGTPGFSAPEHRASPAADVFALAMLAKSLLPPKAYRSGTPWRAVLTEALAAEAALRPADPAALAERIRQLFAAARRRKTVRRSVIWAVLCGLLAVAAAAIWGWSRRPIRREPLREAPRPVSDVAPTPPERTAGTAEPGPAVSSVAPAADAHFCTLACDRIARLKGPKAVYHVTERWEHLKYLELGIKPGEPAELVLDIPAGRMLYLTGTLCLTDSLSGTRGKGPYTVTVRAVGGGKLSVLQVMPAFDPRSLTLRLLHDADTEVEERRPVLDQGWAEVMP